ncbi:phosphonate metabolism transcriptional regulator PhnF [Marinivivus vitaminiproducens]|uniref:phosphonate metabolism transcriptional regulator PhnF n=1 Tax=Marinivivus vitaminiproducens TaxID=3035935 RepID=UPI0027A6740F|nr:phosphonate metabolism transcriptional regulator PhnF [Geminicoccaceae bacterium SCSIO 64248]
MDPDRSAPSDPKLRRGDGVAAWRQIADRLLDDIRAGRPSAGEQLPSEAALAARFGVNRHTVRRAVAELAAEGVVRTSQGKGSFVEAGRLPYPIGTRTRFTQNLALTGHEAGGDLIAAETVPAPAEIASRLQIAPSEPVLRVDLRRFVDRVPLTLGRTYLPLPRFAGFADAYRASESVTAAFSVCGVDDYRRLSTAITARPATVDEAMLLDLAPGRVLLVVDSVNVDGAGRPIQATHAHFVADRVELRVEA